MLIETRTAVASDAIAICKVVRRSISECCVLDHRNDPATLSAWLGNKTPESALAWVQSPDSIGVAAAQGNRLVGFALAKGDELALCYVLPEVLHTGVGKALLQAIESRVISQGFRILRVVSTRTAQSFYSRNGFTMSGPPQVWAGIEGLPMAKAMKATPLSTERPAIATL
jgi:GNAT superfamily N-acetyltransferase